MNRGRYTIARTVETKIFDDAVAGASRTASSGRACKPEFDTAPMSSRNEMTATIIDGQRAPMR